MTEVSSTKIFVADTFLRFAGMGKRFEFLQIIHFKRSTFCIILKYGPSY
jgi:hypothetical protein